MKIFINWKEIKSYDDFYEAFLPQVEAPNWHGRNLDALADSLITGDINKIEPPFCVINTNVSSITPETEEIYSTITGIFNEANEAGRKIRVFNE